MAGVKKIAVIDVDDSLLRGNSLKLLLWYAVKSQIRRGQWLSLLKLCMAMGRRVLHLSLHIELKEQICCCAIESLTEADCDAMTDALVSRIRPEVRKIINHWIADGGEVVIASAGMRRWLKDMVARMGLRYLVATDMDPDGRLGIETRSERKLQGVRSLAASEGLGDIGLVVTDHIDDMPLLSLPDIRRVLVNPARNLLSALDTASLPYEIIN